MNWAVILAPETLALYGRGVLTTLGLLGSSLAVGAVLAVLFALLLTGPWSALRWLVGSCTFVIRGTPLLIQVYLIYYGLAQLDWVQARWDDVWPWTHFKEPFFCAVLAFSLNTAAYSAEMLAGAIRETNAGEIEAGIAMGMTRWQVLRHITLPSALRRVLPPYSNEVVMMLHATSLASAVPALLDITGAASRIFSDFYLPFEAFVMAALIYLVASFMLIGLFKQAERRFSAHLVVVNH